LPLLAASFKRRVLAENKAPRTVEVYPQALQGKGKALDGCLKILARESRLLGLDAPAKTEIHGPALLHDMAHRAARIYPELDVKEIIAEATEE
jgi:hypothetical protein